MAIELFERVARREITPEQAAEILLERDDEVRRERRATNRLAAIGVASVVVLVLVARYWR